MALPVTKVLWDLDVNLCPNSSARCVDFTIRCTPGKQRVDSHNLWHREVARCWSVSRFSEGLLARGQVHFVGKLKREDSYAEVEIDAFAGLSIKWSGVVGTNWHCLCTWVHYRGQCWSVWTHSTAVRALYWVCTLTMALFCEDICNVWCLIQADHTKYIFLWTTTVNILV